MKMASYTDKKYYKDMEIKLSYSITKRNTTIDVNRVARLNTDDFTFAQIAAFNTDINIINKEIKKLTKNAQEFIMTLCIAEYERTPKENSTDLKQISFNWWQFNGINEDDCGLSLIPDERYTDAEYGCYYDFTLESLPNMTW